MLRGKPTASECIQHNDVINSDDVRNNIRFKVTLTSTCVLSAKKIFNYFKHNRGQTVRRITSCDTRAATRYFNTQMTTLLFGSNEVDTIIYAGISSHVTSQNIVYILRPRLSGRNFVNII